MANKKRKYGKGKPSKAKKTPKGSAKHTKKSTKGASKQTPKKPRKYTKPKKVIKSSKQAAKTPIKKTSVPKKNLEPPKSGKETGKDKAKRLVRKAKEQLKKELEVQKPPKIVKGKQYPMYLEGVKLNPKETDFVKRVAEIKGVNVSTPYKLRAFFNKYKEVFKIEFTSGVTSLKKTIPNIIKDIEKADKYKKKFIVRHDGKNPKEVSKEKFIWHLVTTENYINNALGTSFMQLPYTLSFQNEFEVNLPSHKAIKELEESYGEDEYDLLTDELLEDYDMVVYQ